jgi:hypothetical protein
MFKGILDLRARRRRKEETGGGNTRQENDNAEAQRTLRFAETIDSEERKPRRREFTTEGTEWTEKRRDDPNGNNLHGDAQPRLAGASRWRRLLLRLVL